MITTDIAYAYDQLMAGNLVSFPTETVYGLGADATNLIAIQKVFQAKGRPADHPVIVHIADAQQLTTWARDIPNTAWELAAHFWPGPLTLILHKQPNVSALITGGQDTIGLRIPNHPVTLELLRQFGSGLVGPSANKYGRVSPTQAEHVAADLGAAVAAILDGGSCTVGIESTIIDLTADQPVIMRSGAITAAEISKVLGQDIRNNTKSAIRTPGSHASHYAPVTPVQLLDKNDLFATVNIYAQERRSFSVLSLMEKPLSLATNIYWQQVSANPTEYAHDLYANLRQHDQLFNSVILIERPPTHQSWNAVIDRVTRASSRE